MNEIVMPKLSDTMTEGRLVSWKKRVGEEVRRGEVIAEVETDKANMELEAFVSGVLLEIRVQPGELVQVGTVIATIGKAGETGAGTTAAAPEQPRKEPSAGPQGEPAAAEPLAEAATERSTEQAPPASEAPGAEKGSVQGAGPAPGGPAPEFGPAAAAAARERAAPVVRRRARELGIDLSLVQGSGPEGRILLQDLESAGKGAAQPAQPQPAQEQQPVQQPAQPEPKPTAPQLVQEVKAMSRLRSAIAKTVADSWAHIPHFTVTMDIVMDEAESIRRQLKQGGMRVSVNDVLVKGLALALQKFPQLNASYGTDGLHFHDDINISIAVGVPDGVLMPVLSRCQVRSLLEIAQEAERLVERARSGSLSEQEMSGGTFSISNLGMFQVSSFSAIIHPAQAAVLAVGAVVDSPVVRSGVLAGAKLMKVTLSADHRVVDGAYAAQFLGELKEVLENPVRLLI